MKGNIEIKHIDKDCIEILGVKYYTESYTIEMCNRWYDNGMRKGRTEPIKHIAQIEECYNCKN